MLRTGADFVDDVSKGKLWKDAALNRLPENLVKLSSVIRISRVVELVRSGSKSLKLRGQSEIYFRNGFHP